MIASNISLIGWGAAAAAVVAGVLGLWIQEQHIEALTEKRDQAQQKIVTLEAAAQINTEEMERCIRLNAANLQARLDAETRAQKAILAVAELVALAEMEIEYIDSEAEKFREEADEQCRTLDDPLPGAFVDWLRDDSR